MEGRVVEKVKKSPEGEIIYHFLKEDKGDNFGFLYLDSASPNEERLKNQFKTLLMEEPERMVYFGGPQNQGVYFGEDNVKWFDWHETAHSYFMSISKVETLRLKKECAPVYQAWNWLTLAPKPMLDIVEDIDKFEDFIRKLMNPIYFKEFVWVIESGKNESCPNLHAHILFTFKNSSVGKNFKRDAVRYYDRIFKTEKGIDWISKKGKGWYNVKFHTKDEKVLSEIIQDKKEYCLNFSKSALHENYCDLGLSGSYP